MKLLTATRYWATRRLVVSTIKLKLTKKKIVGGNASRASCRSRAPIRRATPAGISIGSAGRLSSYRMGLVRICFLLSDDLHWLAGMVTTGADPFTPVSAIENSSMMIANVFLDWMSVPAIQNHLLSYCTATKASLGGVSVTRTRKGGPLSAPTA